ncbi:MAG: cyclic nucleotide-binding domain-containing protein [Lachnospiraceae bacterium]|nr:cyclic nucleotide-binding domain-containing protein [Lachnospiraceae bacterium]
MEQGGKLFEVTEGTHVLVEGEVNLDMYKIIKGHAELYINYGTDRETLIGIIGPNACFGEFGLLLEKPAIYTVIAYSDLLLLRVTKGDMGDFVQQNHRSIFEIMQNMALTMQAMHRQIGMLIEDINANKPIDPKDAGEIQKTIGKYTVYRNSLMDGKFHTIDSVRDRLFR